MEIKNLKDTKTPYKEISELLSKLHTEGPSSSEILQAVSLYKEFHPRVFQEYEEKIISAIGLFYKIKHPTTLYSFLLSGIGLQHKKEFGKSLTPVQASVRRAIEEKLYISISAPTSAGKSYSIRDFIAEQDGDAVIVVPSRALIAEYMTVMRQQFDGDKHVLITSFVDSIFTDRKLRHIFILTPERARDLFTLKQKFDIKVFFFDEAQVTEEKERGIIFDVLVRRVNSTFPKSKLIFAHPFVDNPDAQFKKHQLSDSKGYARSYTHGSVGKVCIFNHKTNGKDYYYSPFLEKGHLTSNAIEYDGSFEKFAFNGEHTILIYVSKLSIYNGKFLNGFEEHIENLPEIKSPEAAEIINTVAHMVGADNNSHRSRMVSLLRKGVVIHHGSVPLEVRFLIEEFIRKRHARICFATSTLAQGINMPFDIVWLQSMRFMGDNDDEKSLAFKNLIGRAGRLSEEAKFDYGYVYTTNAKLFSERITDKFELSEKSILDKPLDEIPKDSIELIESIHNGTFDDELHLPQTKISRLSENHVLNAAKEILNIIYQPGRRIKDNLSGPNNKPARERLKLCFRIVFEASINRQLLEGESAVFDTAISIFIQIIQGVSFREIVGMRFSRITRRDDKTKTDAAFTQPASKIPNIRLTKTFPLFPDTLAKAASYDAVVFDTYDYVDQVISFSLSDVFMATFKIYSLHTSDRRSEKMVELLRFGTNDAMHMLLMRYGFSPEEIAEIIPYILSITEKDIKFKSSIHLAPSYIQKIVEWYLP